jgi:ADP-ribose pyrophosphatase YjhB (NUDIX family)
MDKNNVSIALIKRGEDLVFQKRNKNPYKGFYGLIGGKIKNGEGPDHALKREIKEESGLDTQDVFYHGDILEILYDNSEKSRVKLSIYSAIVSGEIKSSKAEGNIHLIHPQKLNKYKDKFIPTDWIIINRILKNNLDFTSDGVIQVYHKDGVYEIVSQERYEKE